MSIGILTKQKKFIESELKKGNKNYDEIYQEAKERQFKKEREMIKKVSISQLPKYKHRQKRMDELMKNRKEYLRLLDVTRKIMEAAADEFIEHMKKRKAFKEK